MADQPYSAVLFVHIMAAIALFAGITLTLVGYQRARASSTTEEAAMWLSLAVRADHALPLVALLQLGSGAWLVRDRWPWDAAWVEVALAWFLAMLVLGPLLNGRPLAALSREARRAAHGPLPPTLASRLHSRRLAASLFGMAGSTVGMVWLMATKPGLAGSVAAVTVGAAVGLVVARALSATSPSSQREGVRR
jgi:hypothetical protein